MGTIQAALDSVVAGLSDQSYTESLAFYRIWLDIGQTYQQIPADQTFDAIWNNRGVGSAINPAGGGFVHSRAHLIVRFASDVESDYIPHMSGLQSRLCMKTLQEFFSNNMMSIQWVANCWGAMNVFYQDTNLIARWANLGYVEEAAIRNHILQSLISHSKLWDHQADALIILFKLAGPTFAAYADPSVVDRCFELLKDHYVHNPVKKELAQEVIDLRESGWEGLPPPPVFATGAGRNSGPIGTNQNDPAATPVVTSLGLPSRDPGPRSQTPTPPPLESVTVPEVYTLPESPVSSATQSPSTSIATLSDFTIADASDDESPIDPTIPDTSDDELPTDPIAVASHETFYLEDGNMEVLCGNTLFRVHTTILSFHSPALRRMFAQANLATVESPSGCPRILSSDTAKDFTTLLKMIYLPGFPKRNRVPDFSTFSSLLRITAKYEMPAVRSQVLEVIHNAYPQTFEGLAPSQPLGENVFTGPTPHPNKVLNLFIQQRLSSALPMAYYMAVRRGPDSLIGKNPSRNTTLSPEILRPAVRGLMALREVELNETHRLIFGPKDSHPFPTPNCPLRTPTGPAALGAYQTVFDHIVGSSQFGTKVLEVPGFYEDCEDGPQCIGPGICQGCVERWESGHAELRKKAWATLPDAFGLRD